MATFKPCGKFWSATGRVRCHRKPSHARHAGRAEPARISILISGRHANKRHALDVNWSHEKIVDIRLSPDLVEFVQVNGPIVIIIDHLEEKFKLALGRCHLLDTLMHEEAINGYPIRAQVQISTIVTDRY